MKKAPIKNLMKSFRHFFYLLPFFFFIPYSSAGNPSYMSPHAAGKAQYAEGEVLVKFKEGVGEAFTLQAHRALGAGVIRKYSIVKGLERVKLPRGMAIADAIAGYMQDPSVEYAEPNYIIHKSVTNPNDASFNQLWGLNNTGQSVNGTAGTIDADIDAPEAWDMQTGGTVVVASIDSGVDYNHADLSANMWTNPGEIPGNGKDDDGNGYIDDVHGINAITGSGDPMDDDGHGTHTSGIIGAIGNNGTGVAGVNWSTRIMALKFLDNTGSGYISDAIECIQYAIANGAKVINASYGYYGVSQSEQTAIQSAMNAGILFVAAAGNETNDNDDTPSYPASYNLANIISVASTDQNDVLSSFSNFGATTVDLGAPGENILSTSLLDPTGYEYMSGTSMAAPFVTGAAALVWAVNPALTYAEVRDAILNNIDPNASLSGKTVTGGRLNLFNTLSSVATAPSGLIATVVSNIQIDLSWTDNSTTEDGFKIERKRGAGGTYSEIATAGANVAAYSDISLSPCAKYFYRVRSYIATNNSAYSNVASATTIGNCGGGGGSSECFIATAAFGSYLSPEVMVLREFRDNYLLTNWPGRAFVEFYYNISPPMAEVIAGHDILRLVVRVMLTPLVYVVKYSSLAVISVSIFVVWRIFLLTKRRKTIKDY